MQLIKDLHQKIDYSVKLYCNKQSAIQLVENPVFHARTKHIEVHYHFLGKKVLSEEIEMKPIMTGDQVADIFTESLNSSKFVEFCE